MTIKHNLERASELLAKHRMGPLARLWERIRQQAVRELVVQRLERVLWHAEERKPT